MPSVPVKRLRLPALLFLSGVMAPTFAPVPAAALDSPVLERAADLYRQQLTDAVAAAGETVPDASALFLVAKQDRLDGRWHDAVETYQQLAGLRPDSAVVWLDLAEAWINAEPGDSDALAAAYAAYGLADDDAARVEALRLVAENLGARERWQLAIDVYDELVALQPGDADLAETRNFLIDQYGFGINYTYVANDQDQPQICLVFSDLLSDSRQLRYADYIRIDPAVPVEFLVGDRDICIEGVDHGQTYDLTVLAGLPALDGDRLRRDDSFTQVVDDRPASVGFRAEAYVLPVDGEGTVPLTTVNVDAVELQLLRINDRNLMGEILDGRIGRALDGWDIQQVARDHGEELWTGSMAVEVERNRAVTTGVPVRDFLPEPEPGIYIVAARNADDDDDWVYDWRGTQWLVVSDLGLLSFTGQDGLHVAVRSLSDATPLAGTRVVLLARNNAILGEARSDAEGLATFDAGLVRGEGGNRPAAVMAYADNGDFNFLSLLAPGFDLSDRGVEGRQEPGPLDTYLYTERGVYRPGETVRLTGLLRDERAFGVAGVPLTLKLIRPDGAEARSYTVADQGAGGFAADVTITEGARTGLWTIEAYADPEGAVIGSVQFQVEDFVPLRIRLGLEPEDEAVRAAGLVRVAVDAQYLYGAPAAELQGEAELVLRPAQTPFPDLADYRFGLVQEELQPQRLRLNLPETDARGASLVEAALDALPDTSLPLEADIRATVFDVGGRPVNQRVTLPVRVERPWIGLRSAAGRIPDGGLTDIDIITVDGEGNRIALDGLEWELVREIYSYQWFNDGGTWDYRVINRDRQVTSGTVDVAADTATQIREPLEWGTYRLDVFDPASGAATSLRVSAGWWVSPIPSDTPDTLEISLDQEAYQPGDTARVHLDPPFAGEVLVMVANHGIQWSANVSVPEDGGIVEIPVDGDWGVGAYVLATAFRPAATEARGARGPGRAVGVAWFELDMSDRTLDVAMQAPEVIRPRQSVSVPVTVDGLEPGEAAYLTLAAVDEGILLLTDFASPSADGYFYGKRSLGVEMRDAYGRLIVSEGRRGQVRSGGDGDQMRSLRAQISETVALYSGIVQVDADGEATVTFDIPDYNGELRLMATAWTADSVGSAAQPMTVRDPVVAQVSLPRFLAPGDRAQSTISLRNLDGPEGAYRAVIAAGGEAVIVEGEATIERTLAPGDEERTELALSGAGLGVAEIALDLTGPDGFAIRRTWNIEVRPAQPFSTTRLVGTLPPGEALVVDDGLTDLFLDEAVDVSVSVSSGPNFDVAGLLRSLDRYPYGCVEQTVSRALPLMYLAEVAARAGEGYTPVDTDRRVQDAVNRVLTMQQRSGGFGVWGPRDGEDTWLTAYAMDFLVRAATEGYDIPSAAIERGLDQLQAYVERWDFRDHCRVDAAYALDVLSRAGTADLSDLRYYADTCLPRFETPMAQAQLGVALSRYGETERADAAFAAAVEGPRVVQASFQLRDYGTSLRDRAAVTALMAEADRPIEAVLAQADLAATAFERERWTSTQEQAWLLLAAHALLVDQPPMTLAVDGEALPPRDTPLDLYPTAMQLAAGVRVENLGEETVRRITAIRGVPQDAMPAEENGFRISKAFFTLEGQEILPAEDAIRQNDLIVVVVLGEALTEIDHQALVVDLLPAGLEIENPNIGQSRGLEDLASQLDLTWARHVEMRDDRYIAALDMDGGYRQFAVAYVARAVTPGEFVLPAAFVEDMYQPAFNGRTAMQKLTILPR